MNPTTLPYGGPRLSQPLAHISPREREVLECICAGYTNAETGEELGTTEHTVKRQVQSLLLKLPARNRTHAAVLAVRAGIVGEAVSELPQNAKSGAGPLTPGQLRAFHAKAGAVDDWQKRERGESKRLALAAASSEFKRAIVSANDLDEFEASWVLDHLEAELRNNPP